jgi:hypothetical protein
MYIFIKRGAVLPFAVYLCKKAPVFDVLPAIKVNNWLNAESLQRIYTMARMFVLNNNLHVSLGAFEKEPKGESAISFIFGRQNKYMHVIITHNSAKYVARNIEQQHALLANAFVWQNLPLSSNTAYFKGSDEMGVSFGANFAITAEMLSNMGFCLNAKEEFLTGVYKHPIPIIGTENSINMADFNSVVIV